VHKGRAVCSAVGGIMFGGPAAMVEPIDRERMARAFLTASGTRARAASEIDRISKRKIDSPAQTRGILFLAA
jgi:hypothetical protein